MSQESEEPKPKEINQRSRYDSFRQFSARFKTEQACREAFERAVWPDGVVCPHCGGLRAWRFRGGPKKSYRPGLWQCKECGGQFTVTTNTPLHGTKLPLRTWLFAIYFIFGSSKGISSVVLARHLGVTQKTAWKMGHAIREMLLGRTEINARLKGIVEADTTYVGGAPKRIKYVYNPPGKGTSKQPVLIMTERDGQTRMEVLKNEKADGLRPVLFDHVERDSVLMTDGDKALAKVGKDFKEHHAVRHSMKEFVFDDIHVNRAEGYADQLRRSVLGVYHYLSREHLQRYLNEMAFRWGHRQLYRVKSKKSGKVLKVLAVSSFTTHLDDLMRAAAGRRLHYTKASGLRHADEPFKPEGDDDHEQPPKSTRERRAIVQAGLEGEF